jgi:carbamoyltransferase
MYILGVNISHDGSCCLLQDGEIVFYQEDERLSKFKNNLNPEYNNRRSRPYIFYQNQIIKKYTNYLDYIIFSSFRDTTGYDYEVIFNILNKLKSEGIDWKHLIFEEEQHHLYHASSASFCSGFEECACLILDGAGAFIGNRFDNLVNAAYSEIESIYHFSYSNGFTPKFKHYSKRGKGNYSEFEVRDDNGCTVALSDSYGCGSLFTVFSTSLGYRGTHCAGKIMGLASYGQNTNNFGDWFFYCLDGIGITNNNLLAPLLNVLKYLPEQEQRNALKTLQEETKKHTINLIRKSLEMCNTNNIVLSGGYFLNCVNNYHYLKEFPEVNFYVDPIAHDGGTAIGAAKHLWYNLTKDQTIRKLDSLYLGENP